MKRKTEGKIAVALSQDVVSVTDPVEGEALVQEDSTSGGKGDSIDYKVVLKLNFCLNGERLIQKVDRMFADAQPGGVPLKWKENVLTVVFHVVQNGSRLTELNCVEAHSRKSDSVVELEFEPVFGIVQHPCR